MIRGVWQRCCAAAARGRRSVRDYRERSRRFFAASRDQVAAANLRTLWAAAWVLLAYLTGYGIVANLTLRSPVLLACYGAMLLADGGFLLAARRFRRRMPPAKRIQTVCMLFVAAVMAFTIAISVFPFARDPGIFYPLAYMMLSALFTLPYSRLMALMSGVTAVYLTLVQTCRLPEVVVFDRTAGASTWVLGSVFLFLISDLRLRSGEAQLLLEEVSRTDSLTGLPNRRGAEAQMPAGFRRCQKARLPVTAMMVDVDHFKQYNDRLGHQAGDDCLRAMGALLMEFSDRWGLHAARYGGEEFLLLLPGVDGGEAERLAFRLLEEVRQLALPGPDGPVTVSIGAAVRLPEEADTLHELVQRADKALYRAKADGRNRVVVQIWRD